MPGTAICLLGAKGATLINMFEFARKLVKSWPCYKSVRHSVFPLPFLVTVVDQMVKTPPPPNGKMSRNIPGLGLDVVAVFFRYFYDESKTLLQLGSEMKCNLKPLADHI